MLQDVTLGIVDAVPLIDVFYIRRLGQWKTWLLPVQLILGLIFIILSFYLETLLVQLRIITLTVIFFFIILLIATQDICVDGWALTLFSLSDVIWQSISQMIGQPLGDFIGSSVILIFESANMTDKSIRQPFGITTKPYGLFTLAQFVRFWSVLFLITTCTITILFWKRQQGTYINENDDDRSYENLFETYLYAVKLFKKKNFRQFLIILIGPQAGHAATSAMVYVMLISRVIDTLNMCQRHCLTFHSSRRIS